MTLPAQRAAFLQKAEEERKKREEEEKKRQEEAEKRKAARIRQGNTGSGQKPSSPTKSKSTIKPPARQEAPITPQNLHTSAENSKTRGKNKRNCNGCLWLIIILCAITALVSYLKSEI